MTYMADGAAESTVWLQRQARRYFSPSRKMVIIAEQYNCTIHAANADCCLIVSGSKGVHALILSEPSTGGDHKFIASPPPQPNTQVDISIHSAPLIILTRNLSFDDVL